MTAHQAGWSAAEEQCEIANSWRLTQEARVLAMPQDHPARVGCWAILRGGTPSAAAAELADLDRSAAEQIRWDLWRLSMRDWLFSLQDLEPAVTA